MKTLLLASLLVLFTPLARGGPIILKADSVQLVGTGTATLTGSNGRAYSGGTALLTATDAIPLAAIAQTATSAQTATLATIAQTATSAQTATLATLSTTSTNALRLAASVTGNVLTLTGTAGNTITLTGVASTVALTGTANIVLGGTGGLIVLSGTPTLQSGTAVSFSRMTSEFVGTGGTLALSGFVNENMEVQGSLILRQSADIEFANGGASFAGGLLLVNGSTGVVTGDLSGGYNVHATYLGPGNSQATDFVLANSGSAHNLLTTGSFRSINGVTGTNGARLLWTNANTFSGTDIPYFEARDPSGGYPRVDLIVRKTNTDSGGVGFGHSMNGNNSEYDSSRTDLFFPAGGTLEIGTFDTTGGFTQNTESSDAFHSMITIGANGLLLATGSFSGDGSGLTNLPPAPSLSSTDGHTFAYSSGGWSPGSNDLMSSQDKNTYIGNAGVGVGLREVSVIEFISDDDPDGGSYVTFSIDGSDYYVWFSAQGLGSDPSPGGTGFHLDTAHEATAIEKADALFSLLSGSGFQVERISDESVSITCTLVGNQADIETHLVTRCSVSTTQQGALYGSITSSGITGPGTGLTGTGASFTAGNALTANSATTSGSATGAGLWNPATVTNNASNYTIAFTGGTGVSLSGTAIKTIVNSAPGLSAAFVSGTLTLSGTATNPSYVAGLAGSSTNQVLNTPLITSGTLGGTTAATGTFSRLVTSGSISTTGTTQLGANGFPFVMLTNTANLAFPSTAVNTANSLYISVSGATAGDTIIPGLPLTSGTLVGANFRWFIAATGTVGITLGNNMTVTAVQPPADTFRADVIHHQANGL